MLAAVVLSACGVGGVAGEPWDAAVEGATATTDWNHLEPVGLGPDGRGLAGADGVLGELTQMMLGMYPGSDVDVVSFFDREPPVVFIRASTGAEVPHPLRAVDLLVELRETDSGRWIIDEMRERFHCATPVAARFCE